MLLSRTDQQLVCLHPPNRIICQDDGSVLFRPVPPKWQRFGKSANGPKRCKVALEVLSDLGRATLLAIAFQSVATSRHWLHSVRRRHSALSIPRSQDTTGVLV